MNDDKLGCYRIGELKFYSKLEAIEMHTKTGIHPHWDFNEALFSSYDWTIEPKSTISQLYKKRAEDLRTKYDYIVLMYSGGADSFNVLDTFLSNDIKLDEVASFVNYDATSDKENYLNSEIYKVSIPTINELKTTYPWLNYRLIDLTNLTIDFFKSDQNKFDWIYKLNSAFNPNAASREELPLKIKEWCDIINTGKKFCILWGHDKPRISQKENKFIFRFIDIIDNACTVKSMAGQLPYTDELFYWSPSMPEIVIKQSHLIKNYLNSNNIINLPFISTKKSDLAYKTINGVNFWLDNHGVHSLIYPNWNINTFSLGKPASLILTPRDNWFFNVSNQHEFKQHYHIGLTKLWQTIPEYWKNDPTDISKGFKACWSKEYFLE
jgi:hypothetical protein